MKLNYTELTNARTNLKEELELRTEFEVAGSPSMEMTGMDRWKRILELAVYILEWAIKHLFKEKEVETQESGKVKIQEYRPIKFFQIARIVKLIAFAINVIKRVVSIFKSNKIQPEWKSIKSITL